MIRTFVLLSSGGNGETAFSRGGAEEKEDAENDRTAASLSLFFRNRIPVVLRDLFFSPRLRAKMVPAGPKSRSTDYSRRNHRLPVSVVDLDGSELRQNFPDLRGVSNRDDLEAIRIPVLLRGRLRLRSRDC